MSLDSAGKSDILSEVVGVVFVEGAVKAEVVAAMVAIAAMEVESFMIVNVVLCVVSIDGVF